MVGIFLCIAYLAVIPLCFLSVDHPEQGHATHESSESMPLSTSLSPHTAMFQSLTMATTVMACFALVVISAFYCAVTAFIPRETDVQLRDLLIVRVDFPDIPFPAHILLRRLSLLTHAPPLVA